MAARTATRANNGFLFFIMIVSSLPKTKFDLTAYDYLDKVWKMDEVLPLFSNGQWVLSDYGLEPLWKLGREILNQKTQTKLS